jgi:acetyl esterase/lipase
MMSLNVKSVLICIAIVIAAEISSFAGTGNTQQVTLLWPNGAPGAKGNSDSDKPSLTIYTPDKENANGTAVIICPGGSYSMLASDHEGRQIAQWLNKLGVTGFLLKYRVHDSISGYSHPAPLQDAQRAVRMVRSNAKQWNIDPNRIGILGFSAGGHLASSAGTHFNERYSDIVDNIDQASCRPDFMILIYPVVTLLEPYTHVGSRENLLGKNPDPKLIDNLSNEKMVTAQTPPTFLVHANDDKDVPSENSVNFYLALRKAGVPAEIHIYEKGGHGFGPGTNLGSVSSWMTRCADWMQGRKLLNKTK